MKKHLLEGVVKGAFDSSEAEVRFDKWMNEKSAKVVAKVDRLANEKNKSDKEKLAAETKVKEERAQALARKYAEEAAKANNMQDRGFPGGGFPGGGEITPEMRQRFQQMRGNMQQGGTPGQGGAAVQGGAAQQGGQRDTAAFRRMMQSNPEMRQRMMQMQQGQGRDTSARRRNPNTQGQGQRRQNSGANEQQPNFN